MFISEMIIDALLNHYLDRGREKEEMGPDSHQAPKRPRINRTSRYALDDAMQKTIESNKDKGGGRSGRKD